MAINPLELEQTVRTIEMRFDQVIKNKNIKVPELVACQAEITHYKNNKKFMNEALLEQYWPKMKQLAAMAERYAARSRDFGTSILQFPDPSGSGSLIAHIRYPICSASGESNKPKVRAAIQSAAEALGFTCIDQSSRLSLTRGPFKIMQKDANGTLLPLTPDQRKAYFNMLEVALQREGLKAQIDKLEPIQQTGLTTQSQIGISGAPATQQPGVAAQGAAQPAASATQLGTAQTAAQPAATQNLGLGTNLASAGSLSPASSRTRTVSEPGSPTSTASNG